MKRLNLFYILTFLSLWAWSVESRKLPSFVKRCRRDDPQLNSCMRKAILSFRKYLPKGVRELKIPPLDPYVLDGSSFTGSFGSASFSNLRLYNSYNYDIDHVNVDLENNTIAVNVNLKYAEIKCHYKMSGELFQLPIEAEGDAETQMPDIKTSSVMRGVKIQKNGKEYLDLQTIDFKILSFAHFNFYFHDLFPGNPELTERVHKLLDDNRLEFVPEIQPLLEDVISKIFLSFFKGVFDKFSLDELFI